MEVQIDLPTSNTDSNNSNVAFAIERLNQTPLSSQSDGIDSISNKAIDGTDKPESIIIDAVEVNADINAEYFNRAGIAISEPISDKNTTLATNVNSGDVTIQQQLENYSLADEHGEALNKTKNDNSSICNLTTNDFSFENNIEKVASLCSRANADASNDNNIDINQ